MRTAIATLKSLSPLSWTKYHDTPKLNKESHEAYEERTWRKKVHSNEDGYMIIPPMAFKKSLDAACKRDPIKKKGQQTFTKHFISGVMVTEPLILSIQVNEIKNDKLFVPVGDSASGKRVMKIFPLISKWEGKVSYEILDDVITEDVFSQVLTASGIFIGVGCFRPSSGGYYGRFNVENIEWI